ncbi:DNA primase [Enterobacterales bacterium endosymbiont of Anomoneura mori]|uniref:DNA primase n=1 Tax=Enterobacterales bacterium endosymbiont of Anomoneura mori TaxID=3132096 RepID=UPI00399CD113
MKNNINKTISKIFIKDLIQMTNIIDVINKSIHLKKKGNNYVACCPFHSEKNPSFTVNYEKQFYYCFGCGVHGNVIDFLINYEKFNFIESIEELSILNSVNIIYENESSLNEFKKIDKKKLYKIIKEIEILYKKNLFDKKNIKVLNYLIKRGLSKNIIKKFSIGFTTFKKNSIFEKFKYDEYKIKLLHEIGILFTKNKIIYDRFNFRIMFPIIDRHGKTIGFGGRKLNNGICKYINSPETAIFKKGKNLYGFYNLINKKKKYKYILIVEGYIDYLMLYQYKIYNVVAILGTNITIYNIQLLFRNTDTIIFCYDGDSAGFQAAWNSLKLSILYMKDGKQIKFVFLPDNEDPDTLIKKEGIKNFQKRIDNAKTFTNFLFDKLLFNLDISNLNDRIKFSIKALNLISKIPGDLLRINLRKILSIKIGLLDDIQLENWIKTKSENNYNNFLNIKRTNIRNIISLIIQNPKLSKFIPSINNLENIKFYYPGIDFLIGLLKIIFSNPNINTGQLLEIYRDKKTNKIIKILSKLNISLYNNEKIKKFFLKNIIFFLNNLIKKKIEKLILKSRFIGLNLEEKKKIIFLNKILFNKN